MNKKIELFIAFVVVLVCVYLVACSKSNDVRTEITDETKSDSTDYDNLYGDIISNINKNDMKLEYTGGDSKYSGYQLYDRNNDGINELYIFRVHSFNPTQLTNQDMSSKPFIYAAYNIVDKKPTCFLSGEPRGSSTHDDCYFALRNGHILHLNNSYSDENISIVDDKDNVIKEFHCDYAFVAGNIDHDVYKINSIEVLENEYRKSIESINSIVGYFLLI